MKRSLERFQAPIVELVDRISGMNLRAHEAVGAQQIVEELQAPTLAILKDSIRLLNEVIEACAECSTRAELSPTASALSSWSPQSVRASLLPFGLALDESVAREGSCAVIEEIAFIAKLELRQREDRLRHTQVRHGPTTLLTESDSALRRARKALSAVDASVAKFEGTAPSVPFESEVQTSLSIRRAYARFRRRILGDGEPAPSALRERFRLAGTQIAMLVGRDIYAEMRVEDRLGLRSIQTRILDWLRAEVRQDVEAGLSLWQDAVIFIEMLMHISRRQELVIHDDAAIQKALARVRDTGAALDPELWDTLASLEGLDDDLDELVRLRPPAERAVLEGILKRLSRHAPTPAESHQW